MEWLIQKGANKMSEAHRYISVSFWDDEWIQTLDPSEKFLYLYYMTNPLTNIAGIYKITPRRVAFDTGFTVDTINHIMDKFQTVKKAFRFGEWIILTKWTKHQKVHESDNNRKGIDKILNSLPDDVFYFALQNGYIYQYINELGRPLQAPSTPLQGASIPLNYSNMNSNLNLNSNLNNSTTHYLDSRASKMSFASPPTTRQNYRLDFAFG